MCILETLFMLMATVVAFLYKGGDFYPLLISSGILFGVGISLYAIGFRANEYTAGRREGMLTVTLTWLLLSLLGMLPFYLGGYIDNITDAFFETMSGFTTTGSTILTDIEALPKGVLFWRSLTQWQGGIGMIVFTVALMPILGGGATQMFNAETPGITHERFRPRVTQVAKRLWGVYVFLTVLLIGLLWIGPMNLYDAVNHALTAISTGGYSTKNASIAYWHSAYIEYVITIFMFIGATNITLIYFCLNGNIKKLFFDEEFRWFFWFVLIMTGITTGWIMYHGFFTDFPTAFRQAAFQVVTLVSTCGFATENYIPWGPFFWMIPDTDVHLRLRWLDLRRAEDGTFRDPFQKPVQRIQETNPSTCHYPGKDGFTYRIRRGRTPRTGFRFCLYVTDRTQLCRADARRVGL